MDQHSDAGHFDSDHHHRCGPDCRHDACRRSIEGEGKGVTSNYFKSFKTNFIKATLLWLPFLVALIALVWSWIVLQITPLLIIKFALTILWLIGFEWVFALQARFENTVAGTLKNASSSASPTSR